MSELVIMFRGESGHLDSSLKTVCDGENVASPLQLSTMEVRFNGVVAYKGVEIDDTDSPYLASDETYINVDATDGAVTVTLPVFVSGRGRVYHIAKTDSSGNTVTIGGNGTNINGSSTLVISSQDVSEHVYESVSEWRQH